MIAHEVGHVLQDDLTTFLKIRKHLMFIYKTYIPICIALIIILYFIGTNVIKSAHEKTILHSGWMFGIGGDIFTWQRMRTNEMFITSISYVIFFCLISTILVSVIIETLYITMSIRSEKVADKIAILVTMDYSIGDTIEYLLAKMPGIKNKSILLYTLKSRHKNILKLKSKLNLSSLQCPLDAYSLYPPKSLY